MIKEIKRQRELLRFGKFIDDTVKYGNRHETLYVCEYLNRGVMDSCTIYSYYSLDRKLTIYKHNIKHLFGESLFNDDIVKFLSKRHIINEYTIHG